MREAAFKVGESSVEIGAHYFQKVLDLKPHLRSHQLEKLGLRYFFPQGDNRDLKRRVELGAPEYSNVPSFQLDRGRFENMLLQLVRSSGAEVLDGCSVKAIALDGAGHSVTILCAPAGFRLIDLIRKYDKQSGGQLGGKLNGDLADRKQDEWLLLFVAGMWFQDLWTYNFRRTEMCIIPYATQMGEISICAYNTGVGWRQIVENMHYNASVADWYKANGKHAVYANPKKAVLLPTGSNFLTLKIPRNGQLVDWTPAPKAAEPAVVIN